MCMMVGEEARSEQGRGLFLMPGRGMLAVCHRMQRILTLSSFSRNLTISTTSDFRIIIRARVNRVMVGRCQRSIWSNKLETSTETSES